MTYIADGPKVTSAAHPGDLDLGARRLAWETRLRSRIALTDLVILTAVVVIAMVWRFGTDDTATAYGPINLNYQSLGAIIAVLWWAALWGAGTRDPRILGSGSEEYRRVARASINVIGWVAIASLAFKVDMSRGYLAIAFPLGLLGLLTGRKVWRRLLIRSRRRGHAISKVLVVGGERNAQRICLNFAKNTATGYRVNGVWVPDRAEVSDGWLDIPNTFVPVMGGRRDFMEALVHADADTVIVSDTEHLGAEGLRDLAWRLEGVDIDLMVSPNLVDIAGPRMHMKPLGNEPYIHLQEPQYAAAGNWPKVFFDKTFAGLALLALSPLLIGAAIAVKLTSRGPILYRSERIGVGGEPFQMLKFRSMVVGADRMKTELASDQSGVLFKMKDDPRITRVGKVLRRLSIDELPQLINVLRGDMSMVGPRPPLRQEVELYGDEVHRRLLVRQGITGLWQVSGRSDLDWDETVRLDLDYVENWSMTRDLQIIWKTVRAVLKSDGAY